MNQLEKILKDKGYRLTSPRKQVFSTLERAGHPLSLADLSKTVEEVDRTSIYRTIELFSTLGIIEILHIGWKKQYELASPFQPHHHHLRCTNCNKLVTVDLPELERAVEDFAHSYGFSLTSHTIELLGLCPDCKNTN